MGKESPDAFVTAILTSVVASIIIEGATMETLDFFYFPANGGIEMVAFLLAMAIGGFVSAFFWATHKKHDSPNGKGQRWKGKYISSMIACMVLTPLLVNLILGYAKMEWMCNINPYTYDAFIIIGCLLIGGVVLTGLNQGLKDAYEELKSDTTKVAEIAADAGVDVVELKPKTPKQ